MGQHEVLESDPFQTFLDEIMPKVNSHLPDKGRIVGAAEGTLTYAGADASREAYDDNRRWAQESDDAERLFGA